MSDIDMPPGHVFKPEFQERADFFEFEWGDRGCTCFRNPPCGWCTHEDNPMNLVYEEGSTEPVLVAAVREAVEK